MFAHLAVPLVVAGLHVGLGVGALLSGRDRRTQRLFAALAGVLAAWSASVFQIRHAADETGGLLGQRVINITFGLIPAVHYHLVRVATGTDATHQTAVRVVYTLAGGFTLVALFGLPLLVQKVVPTSHGWAPVTGPLALALFVYYLGVMAATLTPAWRERRTALLAASLVMLVAPVSNFVGFILLRTGVITRDLPPLLLPAGLVFSALVWFATRESRS